MIKDSEIIGKLFTPYYKSGIKKFSASIHMLMNYWYIFSEKLLVDEMQ
jgi:hypothetical protein